MKRITKITTILLLAGMTIAPNLASGNQTFRRQLPNGLTVLIKEDHKLPVVAINTWVNAGYFNEPDSLTGISHLLEHMFFEGTQGRAVGKIALEIKAAGGYLNGGTSYEHTSYYTVLPSESLLKGLDIQSDVLQRSLLDSAELSREARVIIQEIKRKLDNPTVYSYEKLMELAFDKHHIRRWRMGTESQVASWSRAQIVNYFKEAYQPQNIILAVVGDIDSLTAFQEIEKYYGGMVSSPLKITPSPAEPLQTDFRYKRLTADINRSIVYIGFHIPGALSDDYYPLLVLDFILSGGKASRLTQEVKEKQGLAEVVNSSCVVYKDFGYFSINGEQVEGDPQKLLAALIEQVERFKLRNVSDAELTRALNQLESDYLHGLQDVNDQAQKLAYYESYGDYRLADTYLDRLRRVNAADIKRVAQAYFTLENAAVLEYLPKGKEFNSYTTDQLKQYLADDLSKFRRAPRYAVDDIAPIVTAPPVGGQDLPDQPAQKQVIENGITVICKENHSLPIVSVAAYFLGGAFNETPDNWGVTQLLARTSLKGAGSYSAANIAGDIEGLGGSINSEVTSDYFGFRFESMANNFEECFSIFSRVILDPIFPETELQKEKKDLIAAIQRLKDSTEDYPLELCRQALFEGTSYGAPSLGDIASIEKIGTTDLINKHRRAVTTGNFVIAYVGDITLDQAVLLTRRHFRDMNVARRATIPALQLKPVAVKTKIEKREKAQTAQAFAFLTCPCYNPDYEPLKLYQNIISGMGGRLWTEVRERKSLAYTVYAYQEPRALAGSFICFIATSPENALVARDLSLKVISGLKDSLPNSDELQTAKNYTVGMFLINLQTNAALADLLAKWELMGRGYESVMEYPQRIRNLNIDAIRNVAAKYFTKKNYGLGIIEGGKSPGRK